jgi:hypothetical protein
LTTALTAALVAGGLAVGTAAPAQAAPVPGDDRLQAQPVSWWSYSNLTAADVSAKLQANSARLTDVRVENGTYGQWRFTVTMVANSGSYGAGWAWYFNKSAADVETLLTQNSARPTSMQRYWNGSAWRYVVVMVANSGANYRPWTTVEGTATGIENATRILTGYRLAGVSADACTIYTGCTPPQSHYLAIFEGNPEGYVAKFHHGKTAAALGSATAGTQLVDLDPNDDGTFNAITYSKPWAPWSWWFDQSIGGLVERALQHGMRLIDVTSYHKNGNVYYAGIMVENLTGLSAQLRDMYEGKIKDGGRYGFRLRRWNGPVLAALRDDVVYEPASAIKALIHLHVMRNEQNGLSPDTAIDYRYTTMAYPDMTDAGSCPIGAPKVAPLELKKADQAMMLQSDNRMTHGIYDFFQTHAYKNKNDQWVASPVAQTATMLNLPNTKLQLFSCDRLNYPDATTLKELATIYEAGYLRTDVLDDDHREAFKMNMDRSVWASFLNTMIAEERQSVGLTAQNFDNFVRSNSMGKGGMLTFGGLEWRANGGLVAIPNDPYGTNVSYYEWGSFVDKAPATTAAEVQAVTDTNNAVWVEALRPYVHEALVNWKKVYEANGWPL